MFLRLFSTDHSSLICDAIKETFFSMNWNFCVLATCKVYVYVSELELYPSCLPYFVICLSESMWISWSSWNLSGAWLNPVQVYEFRWLRWVYLIFASKLMISIFTIKGHDPYIYIYIYGMGFFLFMNIVNLDHGHSFELYYLDLFIIPPDTFSHSY